MSFHFTTPTTIDVRAEFGKSIDRLLEREGLCKERGIAPVDYSLLRNEIRLADSLAQRLKRGEFSVVMPEGSTLNSLIHCSGTDDSCLEDTMERVCNAALELRC